MAKFCLKKPSKRMEARKRYKIEKKVREHNRKARKEAKKNLKKKPKMVQIPNQCPFKEEILKEVEDIKKHHEDEKQKAREARRAEWENGGLKGLVTNSESEDTKLNEPMACETSKDGRGVIQNRESLIQTYYKEFKKVINTADIILEVVDARDPLGTRCKQVEEIVYASKGNKRLVIILNKADLVSKENLEQWLTYFRQSVPVLAFQSMSKSSGKKQTVKSDDTTEETCFGTDLLQSLFTNYIKNNTGGKPSIRVGIVGLPNVGKSSIINSLKKSEECDVSNIPGVTKEYKVVQLESKIKLLDSPGILFSTSEDEEVQNSIALKNLVRVTAIKDPVNLASSIIERISTQKLMEMYDVLEFSSPQEFLEKKASRMGRYKKGGIPDMRAAARSILEDWNSGKIRYYTIPPEEPIRKLSPEVASQVAQEFQLDNIIKQEKVALDNFQLKENEYILDPLVISSSGPMNSAMERELKKQAKIKSPKVNKEKKTKIEKKFQEKSKKIDVVKGNPETEENQKIEKMKKWQLKKQKKEAARKAKQEASVEQPTDGKTVQSDDYDFKTDFK